MEAKAEEHQPATSPVRYAHFQKMNPIWRVSPSNSRNRSTLYDSYELRALTRQLNKAIQGPHASSPPYYVHRLKSPVYRRCLKSMHKESVKSPRRIASSKFGHPAKLEQKPRADASRGLVTRLWKKIRQGWLNNRHGAESTKTARDLPN